MYFSLLVDLFDYLRKFWLFWLFWLFSKAINFYSRDFFTNIRFWIFKYHITLSRSYLLTMFGPTKYTGLYVTFWRPKLRNQFSETLVLWIFELLFNFGDRISKKKKNMELLKIENLKDDKNFQLTHWFLIKTLLFVRIEQKSKTEIRKQPFKCVP